MARYNAMLDTESTMYNRTVGLSGHERATTPGRRAARTSGKCLVFPFGLVAL